MKMIAIPKWEYTKLIKRMSHTEVVLKKLERIVDRIIAKRRSLA